MSRVGNRVITVPKEVKIVFDKHTLCVYGPKGQLSYRLPSLVQVHLDSNRNLIFQKCTSTNLSQKLHGLVRTLVLNMVIGVSKGFSKQLNITGVGYKAELVDSNLILYMGYSHPVLVRIPTSIFVKCENPTTIIVSGIRKDFVSAFASKIRFIRPPEPYKGKGITYENEVIRYKVGKTGK
jgi:large subunit ribosomal protein L6